MRPTGEPSSVVTDQADARHMLNDELRDIDDRLLAMVDAYEEKPSAIDNSVLNAANRDVDIEAAITEAYRIMKDRVYANESLLRGDNDVWEAFKEQQDEFISFYKAALKALETYTEVLKSYRLVQGDATQRPHHGDLELIRQDKHAQVEERNRCIEALTDFQGKFSAMLTILFSS